MIDTKEITKKLDGLKKAYIAVAQEEFKNGTAKLFAENPSLEKIILICHTPYADGDTPEYRVSNDYPEINPDENGRGRIKYKDPLYNVVTDFLCAFDNDVYRDLFGDGVSVIITKDNIATEGFDDY